MPPHEILKPRGRSHPHCKLGTASFPSTVCLRFLAQLDATDYADCRFFPWCKGWWSNMSALFAHDVYIWWLVDLTTQKKQQHLELGAFLHGHFVGFPSKTCVVCCLLWLIFFASLFLKHPPAQRKKNKLYQTSKTTSTPKNSSCMQVIWIHLVPQQLPGWQVRGGSGGSSPGGFSFSSVDSPSTYRTPYLFRDYFWGFSQKTSVESMWSLACYQISSVK